MTGKMKLYIGLLVLGLVLLGGGLWFLFNSSPRLDINPDPSVHFPQLKTRSRSFMEAELYGEMVLEDGYLRVDGTLIIWQPDYFVHNNEGTIEVLDRKGKVVARVGEEVYMGGGEDRPFNKDLREPLPQDIEGPFWIQGGGTRLNLNFSSDLFSLEIITSGDHKYYFLKKKPLLEELTEQKITITGKLVASYGENLLRCPHIGIESKNTHYTPIWPANYQARVEAGVLEIVDGDGQVAVRDGEEVSLEGFRLSGINSEIPRQLNEELPGECYRTYLIVGRLLGGIG